MGMHTFHRKVLILGVLIVILAGTYIVGLVFSPARVGRREAEAPLIAGFDRQVRDRVAEIRIGAEQGNRILLKREDSWILPGGQQEYPASKARIDSLLDFIAELARSRFVTSNPDSWKEFEVHEQAVKRIELLDSTGASLTEIIVGKPATGSSDAYVRLGGSNEVLLTNRSFDYYLNVQERFWAYLRIFPEELKGESIMRITVDSNLRFDQEDGGPSQYTLVLASEQPVVWELAEGSDIELDNGAVDLLADNLAGLEGVEFAHGISEEEAGVADPAAGILFSTVDGQDYRLGIGAEAGDDQYYLAREGGPYIYKVSEWAVKGILKSIEELRDRSEE
jgi:hypothetical protein